MIFNSVSSASFSVDEQTKDAVRFLVSDVTATSEFTAEFPEFHDLVWSGSYVDTEASGVDPEYMEYVREWIEDNTSIYWLDGEPVMPGSFSAKHTGSAYAFCQ